MSTLTPRLTIEHALSKVRAAPQPFIELLAHGSLVVEFYQPDKVDLQEPHSRDEIYVIVSGEGEFNLDGEREPFESGEVLFVPAGVEHRFEEFTEDFATWVFFFGPEGGEAAQQDEGFGTLADLR